MTAATLDVIVVVVCSLLCLNVLLVVIVLRHNHGTPAAPRVEQRRAEVLQFPYTESARTFREPVTYVDDAEP